MAGQSAALSLKEAKAMQERVQCGTNHSHTHGEGGKSNMMPESHRKKAHKGQQHDHANVDHH
jgi:hypothetical protein